MKQACDPVLVAVVLYGAVEPGDVDGTIGVNIVANRTALDR